MTDVQPIPQEATGLTLAAGVEAIAPAAPARKLGRAATELLRRRPTVIRDRIESLISRDEHLERIATQSYWHENGFAKIRLLRGSSFGVRLHVWPAGPDRLGEVDPHGHRWAFASWIAAGVGVEETIYLDVTGRRRDSRVNALVYTRYEYSRDTNGFLAHPQEARLRVAGRRRHVKGEVYSCAQTALHVVAPIGTGLVATIVLQGPATLGSTPVYSRRGRPAVTDEEPIDTDVLRKLLREVAAEIDRTEAPEPRYSPRRVYRQMADRLPGRTTVKSDEGG
ncbi:MAG: hypothetical protein L0K86_07380 [Actinomycetia bacterium]|nr:hypothetical protein [Actinomycetes bacterium]